MWETVLEYKVAWDEHALPLFHVGSGYAGRHGADQGICRGRDGELYIPGDTIKGLLRDAAERLPGWLRNRTKPPVCKGELGGDQSPCPPEGPRCPACRIFLGERYLFSAVTYSDQDRAALQNLLVTQPDNTRRTQVSDLVADLQVVASHHASIDHQLGRSKPDHLFSIELGDVRWPLLGSVRRVRLEAPSAQQQAELEEEVLFLYLCARHVDGVGGKRRKGVGRCRLDIISTSVGTAAQALSAARSHWGCKP